ncbi:hypothetical protein BJ165DRAFT_264817 [Panaeolus papilionaceus]|nr:hypothetical protein BJ165DRAFT_264817 [Panaeolus papilionaceus]
MICWGWMTASGVDERPRLGRSRILGRFLHPRHTLLSLQGRAQVLLLKTHILSSVTHSWLVIRFRHIPQELLGFLFFQRRFFPSFRCLDFCFCFQIAEGPPLLILTSQEPPPSTSNVPHMSHPPRVAPPRLFLFMYARARGRADGPAFYRVEVTPRTMIGDARTRDGGDKGREGGREDGHEDWRRKEAVERGVNFREMESAPRALRELRGTMSLRCEACGGAAIPRLVLT